MLANSCFVGWDEAENHCARWPAAEDCKPCRILAVHNLFRRDGNPAAVNRDFVMVSSNAIVNGPAIASLQHVIPVSGWTSERNHCPIGLSGLAPSGGALSTAKGSHRDAESTVIKLLLSISSSSAPRCRLIRLPSSAPLAAVALVKLQRSVSLDSHIKAKASSACP